MYTGLLIINASIFAVLVAYYLRQRCASIFHPATFFLSVHCFLFVVRPIMAWIGQYRSVYQIYGFVPTMEEKAIALSISLLASVVLVPLLVRLAPEPIRFVRVPDDIRARLGAPIVLVGLTLGLIAFYSASRNFSIMATGADTMSMTRTGYKINTSGVGYLTDAQLMLVPITLMIAWVFRFRLFALVPFALFVFVKSGSGGRGPFVIAIAAMGLLYLYEQGRKWPTARVFGIFSIALALFVIVGQDRGRAVRQILLGDDAGISMEDSGRAREAAFLDGMDYGHLEYVEFLVHIVPKRTRSYTYFTENLQILTEPVPRILWSGKPVGPPITFFNYWDYGTPFGLTFTIQGLGWIGLGWLGVLIYAALAAVFLAAIYRYFLAQVHSPLVTIAYITFLAGTILYFRDGALITIIRTQVFYLAPVYAVFALSRNVRLRIRLLGALGPARYKALIEKHRVAGARTTSSPIVP